MLLRYGLITGSVGVAKYCTGCKQRKSASAFTKSKQAKDGLQNRCRTCHSSRSKERTTIDAQRKWRYLKEYGITLEQYDSMLAAQNNVCAICKEPPGKQRLHVDHCHKTGQIRGLLCASCNIGIGYFRDSEALLGLAIQYLYNAKEKSR